MSVAGRGCDLDQGHLAVEIRLLFGAEPYQSLMRRRDAFSAYRIIAIRSLTQECCA